MERSRQFILASGSPRRRELLARAGFRFEIITSSIVESDSRALSMRELTLCNATRKANAIARMHRDAVVLAADTTVSLDGETIGKPRDVDEATQILRRLSGREHQVCTGVSICAPGRLTNSFCVISHVSFHSLGEEQIARYLTKIDPLDKAGAYAAQAHGSDVIKRIRGSFTNVVGLPMDETVGALQQFGIEPER